MAKLIRKRLDGATLIEVLIAMVIIMAVFSIAIAVFSNVLSSGVSSRQIQANAEMERLRLQILNDTTLNQSHLLIDSIDYDVVFMESNTPGLTLVEIKAIDHRKLKGQLKFLMANRNGNKAD
jgi:type II secretory pathway pseudopilin PulG